MSHLEKTQCLQKTLYTALVTLRKNLTALLGYGDNAYRQFYYALGKHSILLLLHDYDTGKRHPFSMGSQLFIKGPWSFDHVHVA
jgi:hypothetical protein